MIGIYQIRNTLDNRVYVGSSSNISRRFTKHKRYLNTNKHGNPFLQRAWNKYGADAFEFSVIAECEERDKLVLEQIMINYYNTTPDNKKLYNIVLSGLNAPPNSTGRKEPEELKRKRSESGKKFWDSPDGTIRKAELSKKFKNRVISPESRAKMSEAQKRKKSASIETRQKISKALKGRVFSPEHRDRISKGLKGRKVSPETREKQREARKRFNTRKREQEQTLTILNTYDIIRSVNNVIINN